MRVLSESVGLAWPRCEADLSMTADAVQEARQGIRDVEVRVGVGPVSAGLSARVLGYAACVAEALRLDVVAVCRPATRIVLFSSAPKAGRYELSSAVRSLVALGGALRICGVDVPIELDLAEPVAEVPR